MYCTLLKPKRSNSDQSVRRRRALPHGRRCCCVATPQQLAPAAGQPCQGLRSSAATKDGPLTPPSSAARPGAAPCRPWSPACAAAPTPPAPPRCEGARFGGAVQGGERRQVGLAGRSPPACAASAAARARTAQALQPAHRGCSLPASPVEERAVDDAAHVVLADQPPVRRVLREGPAGGQPRGPGRRQEHHACAPRPAGRGLRRQGTAGWLAGCRAVTQVPVWQPARRAL